MKYNDGDQEILNLHKERWLYVEGDSESDGVCDCHIICIRLSFFMLKLVIPFC